MRSLYVDGFQAMAHKTAYLKVIIVVPMHPHLLPYMNLSGEWADSQTCLVRRKRRLAISPKSCLAYPGELVFKLIDLVVTKIFEWYH